jgi:hypothetical protein
MEIYSIHRMPHADQTATIFVLDRQAGDQMIYLDITHAWNPAGDHILLESETVGKSVLF